MVASVVKALVDPMVLMLTLWFLKPMAMVQWLNGYLTIKDNGITGDLDPGCIGLLGLNNRYCI